MVLALEEYPPAQCLLFMIEEPLAKEHGWYATPRDRDEYRKTREIATEVKTLMATSIEPCQRVLFQHRDLYSMLRALKSLFTPKVRALKYDCLNEFFNTKMEENTNIDYHLSNMHRIYRRLVEEFECEITDEIRKFVLLQSLPPSYSAFFEGHVIAENNDNFH
jgi:DNA modification methylase